MSYLFKFTQICLIALLSLAIFASTSLGAETSRYIVKLKSAESLDVSAQSVSSLGMEIESQGGVVDHEFASIGAVAVQLSESQLAELSERSDIEYIVPDGIVATPERWAADSEQSTLSEEIVRSVATNVEFYPWGVKRISAPLMHRTDPRDLMAALAFGALGIFVGGGIFRRRGLFYFSTSKSLGLSVLFVGGLLFATGCTGVSVFPHVGVMGEDITVALLDTGIELDHPDLEDNVLGGVDFVNSDFTAMDDNGHGTGVAGVLAAQENGTGLIGVAPQLKMWAVKTLRFDEQGTIADVIAGIEWAMEREVDIIGMSLGTDDDNRALREAVQAAERAGILLVAAAGNNGEKVLFPAAYPEVIAVGATDEDDKLAWFSNQGSELELVAPGTHILTTSIGKGYAQRDGTSFSVPHVIGVGAMLISLGVDSPREVRNRLTSTAENLGLGVTAQGYGMVNAERAVLGTTGP